METIWIIGGGRFGRLALERLSVGRKKRKFVMVDSSRGDMPDYQGIDWEFISEDGPAFLGASLGVKESPDWIIPAVPVHLAAEWLLLRLGEKVRRVKPADLILSSLPNPMRGENGDIYVSHADFLCPDDCAEPGNICTVTKKPRPKNMFDVFRDLVVKDWQPIVTRSRQLGSGVGGYRPEALFNLLNHLEKATGRFLVATACRCHGVATGVMIK